ncbi:MAG: hypothetical protein ACTSWY_14465 [Promethearchaeota archaeon]
MDSYSAVLTDWIEQLRSTDDKLRVEIAIEDIVGFINELGEKKQVNVVYFLLKKLESEKSDKMIKNTLNCITQLDRKIITFHEILGLTQNSKLIDGITELYPDQQFLMDISKEKKIIANKLNSKNSEVQNSAIKLIGKWRSKGSNNPNYEDKLIEIMKNLFFESIQTLENIIILFQKNLNKDKSKLIDSISCKIQSFLPEVYEYNSILEKYVKENRNSSFFAGTISNIKNTLIHKIITKIKLIIDCFINLNSAALLRFIRNLVSHVRPKCHSKDFNLFNNENYERFENKINILKIKILCYYYLGNLGNKYDLYILSRNFKLETDENIKISIIYAMGNLKKVKPRLVFEKLKEIASDDLFYFYAVSSMLKLEAPGIYEFILDQLESNNIRKVLLTTFFFPYLKNNVDFETISFKLLEFKQPLIIRQALWIIKEKHIIKAIPNVVAFIFSENSKISKDAHEVLLDFGKHSLDFLKSRINYYGVEKKEILMGIMKKIEE